MKILALDISTKTGYAVLTQHPGEPIGLVQHGLIQNPKKINEYGDYPFSYHAAADNMAKELWSVVTAVNPDVIVIEETNSSKARYTQKILEFIHCSFLTQAYSPGKSPPQIVYISTSTWRRNLGLTLSKEDKKNNAKVNRAKYAGKSKKELGLKGKITPKHLAVAYVNERFGLTLKVKDNDRADAICQGLAFLNGAETCNGE